MLRYFTYKNTLKIATIIAIASSPLYLIKAGHAQDATNADLIPVQSISAADSQIDESKHTHPPIRLTPDKSEIITLKNEAASIIIGNPNHLSILADSSKRLVLVPRAAGASSFTVLGHDGEIIMQRHAIIASPKKEYVRIRRSCAASKNDDCQETRVFYCPDMCHEIDTSVEKAGNAGADLAAGAQAAAETQANDLPDPTE